jgi:hypothetical protein
MVDAVGKALYAFTVAGGCSLTSLWSAAAFITFTVACSTGSPAGHTPLAGTLSGGALPVDLNMAPAETGTRRTIIPQLSWYLSGPTSCDCWHRRRATAAARRTWRVSREPPSRTGCRCRSTGRYAPFLIFVRSDDNRHHPRRQRSLGHRTVWLVEGLQVPPLNTTRRPSLQAPWPVRGFHLSFHLASPIIGPVSFGCFHLMPVSAIADDVTQGGSPASKLQ